MKDVKKTLLDRRSIRRYEREDVGSTHMEFIYDAIRNTPTSYNGQQFSVIDVTDHDLKERLFEITGQKQIKTCSHFLVFCADYHKISVIDRAKGVAMPEFYNTLDGAIVGVVDASLALMSALVAAESLGLGTCPIGYARTADPQAIARVLELPQRVFVVCGLAIGVPREQPDMKPKQPHDLMIFADRYRTDHMADRLMDYDREISSYNRSRSGSTSTNDWAAHITSYYAEAMNYHMLQALRARGFDIRD